MIHRSLSRIVRVAALVLALIGIAGLQPVSAHPELLRSEPAADALLAAPVPQLELWFSERIDIGAGSPQVELVNEDGVRFPTNALVDPNDPYHVIADASSLDFGTWTVAWQVRSLDDGHTLTGSYAFRIGGANRAPGAATTEGERPEAWNVATRWLTFLGAALAAGAAALLLLCSGRLLKQPSSAPPDRIRIFALFGAAVAALATLAEPFLLTRFPPAGSLAPSLDAAFDSQPDAWLMRLAALVIATALASVALANKRASWLPVVAGATALVGAVGLSMTGHAAARENLRALAISVDAIHQISIALWIGMLILIVLAWRSVNQDVIARFSMAALPLILIGIIAGVVNSIFVLPELPALWESDYGRVIIAKVLVLGGVLLLALFNRSTLMRAATAAAAKLQKLRVPIRAEALLATFVALGGSILSLLAPASIATTATISELAITHYSAPAEQSERLLITLHLSPATPGVNDIGISITDLDFNRVPNELIQQVSLDFASLTSQTSQPNIATYPSDDGIWRVDGMQLSIADWWSITASVRRADLNDAAAEFFVILPDPNLGEFPNSASGDDDPAARELFDHGLTSLTSLHRVTYTQQVASGSEGEVVLAQFKTNDGFDGSTPAQSVSTAQTTSITIGTTRWLGQTASGRWGATQGNPPIPPFEWGDEYAAATGFRLGGIEEINGEQAQVVTFYTPQTNTMPAYYSWWVSTETGQLLQIAMVSRVHYMTQMFSDFDGDVVIEPPVNDLGTPVATPGVEIATIGG